MPHKQYRHPSFPWLLVGLALTAWVLFSLAVNYVLSVTFTVPARAEPQFLEVAFKACRVEDRKQCREEALQVSLESVTPQQCMAKAQEELARWAEGHPKWFIARWTCRRPGVYAKA